MEVKEMLATKGSKCRPGTKLVPKYITIHNTANTSKGAGAENHGKYLQGSGKNNSVSWHFAVDDKQVVACIPENEIAWHAGDGSKGTGNTQSLAIEICENPESDLLAATNKAAELTAYLISKYGIPIENVVQHNRWSGKDCPRRIRKGEPYNWNIFISAVQQHLQSPPAPEGKPGTDNLYRVQVGAFASKENAKAYAEKVKAAGFQAVIV